MHAARQLKKMAEECRSLAVAAKAAEIREQLLELAEKFTRLARHREMLERDQIRTLSHSD